MTHAKKEIKPAVDDHNKNCQHNCRHYPDELLPVSLGKIEYLLVLIVIDGCINIEPAHDDHYEENKDCCLVNPLQDIYAASQSLALLVYGEG